MQFSFDFACSIRPYLKSRVQMRISRRLEVSNRFEKPNWNSGQRECQFISLVWTLRGTWPYTELNSCAGMSFKTSLKFVKWRPFKNRYERYQVFELVVSEMDFLEREFELLGQPKDRGGASWSWHLRM